MIVGGMVAMQVRFEGLLSVLTLATGSSSEDYIQRGCRGLGMEETVN